MVEYTPLQAVRTVLSTVRGRPTTSGCLSGETMNTASTHPGTAAPRTKPLSWSATSRTARLSSHLATQLSSVETQKEPKASPMSPPSLAYADETGSLAAQQRCQLTETIESQIIPRLMLAHGMGRPRAPLTHKSHSVTAEDIHSFTTLIAGSDLAAAHAFVDGLIDQGTSTEALLLDLLAPAARALGEDWEEDRRDFAEVTIALSRLQQILRDFSPGFDRTANRATGTRRALIAPAPGEQHTFGIAMVEHFFRREGWDVWTAPASSHEGLVSTVRENDLDLVALSLSCSDGLDRLAQLIGLLRRASRVRSLVVMVGGPVFVAHPEWLAKSGADATAPNATEAVLWADRLVAERQAATQ